MLRGMVSQLLVSVLAFIRCSYNINIKFDDNRSGGFEDLSITNRHRQTDRQTDRQTVGNDTRPIFSYSRDHEKLRKLILKSNYDIFMSRR